MINGERMAIARLEAVFFPDPDNPARGDQYRRLAAVLRRSAERHCPDWTVNVREIEPHTIVSALPYVESNPKLFADNAHKSVEWGKIVGTAEDGERIVLVDCDTFVRRPLAPVWEREFDVARTIRRFKWPWNSGVMFVRVNERSKKFFRLITAETMRLIGDAERHRVFERKYGGTHQAAIGAVIESGAVDDVKIIDLPCAEWNNEHRSRAQIRDARIVHFLPSGRNVLFNRSGEGTTLAGVIREWRKTEGEVVRRWDEILRRLPAEGALTGAEIGVWRGDTSRPLLESGRFGKLYLVDPWQTGRPGSDWYRSASKMPKWNQTKYDEAYRVVSQMAKAHGDTAEVMRMTSEQGATKVADRSLDLVFIDANHTQSAVAADLRLWHPKVKPGGWIGGHDIDEPRFPGVRQAVVAAFGRDAFEVGGDYTWFRKVEADEVAQAP